jgi:hypothetical protein
MGAVHRQGDVVVAVTWALRAVDRCQRGQLMHQESFHALTTAIKGTVGALNWMRYIRRTQRFLAYEAGCFFLLIILFSRVRTRDRDCHGIIGPTPPEACFER